MAEPERISPEEGNKKLKAGALFVCAYDDEDKFNMYRLDGAISLKAFKLKFPSLSKGQEIIFYCA